MKKLEFFPIDWFCCLNTHGLKKKLNSLGYCTIARSALPKSEFGEHATNKDPRFKQIMKNTDCVVDFCQ